jgi:FtsH-binding integral membrane protein
MDQFFKLFEVIMDFTAVKSQTISKQLLGTVKRTILYVIVSLGAMTLFCIGISMALTDLALQLDKPLMVGLILAFISLCVFIFSLSQKPWVNAASITNEVKNNENSPIEEALALLIKDIVEERQAKRVSSRGNESQNV